MKLIRKFIWIGAVALRLGHGTVSKIKLFFGGIWFFLTDRGKSRLRFQAELVRFGTPFTFTFQDLGDYGTLHEVFLDGIYDMDLDQEPGTIFDLGSNIGVSTLYFRLRYPDAKIYGFEPDPRSFERLREMASDWPDVEVFPFAVWSHDGCLEFYSDPHRTNSSSCWQRRGRQRAVEVEARTLEGLMDLVDVESIDLLKFDVEGAETEIFGNFDGFHRIGTMVGEVHADMTGGLDRFLRLISRHHRIRTRQLSPDRFSCEASLLPA